MEIVIYILKNIVTPTVIMAFLGWLFIRSFKFGELHNKFLAAVGDISNLKADLKNLKSDIAELTKSTNVIRTYFVNDLGMNTNLFGAHSPLKLLPDGEKLLNKSGFVEIYKSNKELFLNKVRNQKPKTAADIDNATTKILFDMEDDPLLGSLKEVAFNAGVQILLLLKICALYLRDEAIKEFLKPKTQN